MLSFSTGKLDLSMLHVRPYVRERCIRSVLARVGSDYTQATHVSARVPPEDIMKFMDPTKIKKMEDSVKSGQPLSLVSSKLLLDELRKLQEANNEAVSIIEEVFPYLGNTLVDVTYLHLMLPTRNKIENYLKDIKKPTSEIVRA